MAWVKIEDAPLNTLGFIWSPELNWDDRTYQTGEVYALSDGKRLVASDAKGWKFTHWHPLLAPPKAEEAQ